MSIKNTVYRLATDKFVIELDRAGRAVSLRRGSDGPELLAASNGPVFTIGIGKEVLPLSKLSWMSETSRLVAASADDRIHATFAVLNRPGHLAFWLEELQGVTGRLTVTLRLELAITGRIGELIATVHGGADAVGLQGLTADCRGSAETTPSGSAVWVTLQLWIADCGLRGGGNSEFGIRNSKSEPGVALFACPGKEALETIGQIEIAEGLPHPVADGVWARKSRATRQSYLAADFSPDEIEEAVEFATRGGLKTLYLPPWIWASGQGSWANTMGHFGVNTDAFPGGEKDLRALSDRIGNLGMQIGAHTMSAWISPDDSYVTPVPHPDLAAWARGILAEDIGVDATEIPVEGDGDFSPSAIEAQGGWYGFTIARIGDELIRYDGRIEGRHPAVLRGCSRGVYGTTAAAHRRGEEVRLLIQAYGHFVPDPESELLREQAAQLSGVMNRCRLGITSLDGLESLNFWGDWGMNRFVEAVFRGWDHHVVFDVSTMAHFLWHMVSRGNWGENMVNLRDEVERRSRLDNIALQQRNLMPTALGWWPLRLRTTDYEATNTDDFEYILAKCAGYDACFCIESSIKTMRVHPQTGRILDLVKAWESLRNAGVFTEEQRRLLCTNGLDFRLDITGSLWRVTPVKTDKPVVRIAPGKGQRLSVPVENPYQAQPLRFTIRVLPGLDRAAEGSVSLLPASAGDLRPGPQPGSLTVEPAGSQSGAPAYCLVCDYTHRFEEVIPPSNTPKVRDAESSPPVRFSWPVGTCRELPGCDGRMVWKSDVRALSGEVLDLSRRRGLGMWLDAGKGSPGAMLFIELADPTGQVRQYYAPLDEPGRRWIEWPNGEVSADRYYDYEWSRGPNSNFWEALKWFDYSRVTQVRFGMVRVAPGAVATAVVEGLRALPERVAILSQPVFRLGEQRLSVEGEVASDQYLTYEGGSTATVLDANWGLLGELPVQGDLRVPPGASEVAISSEGEGVQPWLGMQMRVVGPSFRVVPPAREGAL
ncbi:MAG: hypothetical protein V1800_08065 [Candidatus Latescibacterota bacterium]